MGTPQSDVVEQILLFNAGREPERLALKYAAMRRGAFVFCAQVATCFISTCRRTRY